MKLLKRLIDRDQHSGNAADFESVDMGSIPLSLTNCTRGEQENTSVCRTDISGIVTRRVRHFINKNIRVWYNGCALVSKTKEPSSILGSRANLIYRRNVIVSKKIIALVALIVLGLGLVFGYKHFSKETPKPIPAPVTVQKEQPPLPKPVEAPKEKELKVEEPAKPSVTPPVTEIKKKKSKKYSKNTTMLKCQ